MSKCFFCKKECIDNFNKKISSNPDRFVCLLCVKKSKSCKIKKGATYQRNSPLSLIGGIKGKNKKPANKCKVINSNEFGKKLGDDHGISISGFSGKIVERKIRKFENNANERILQFLSCTAMLFMNHTHSSKMVEIQVCYISKWNILIVSGNVPNLLPHSTISNYNFANEIKNTKYDGSLCYKCPAWDKLISEDARKRVAKAVHQPYNAIKNKRYENCCFEIAAISALLKSNQSESCEVPDPESENPLNIFDLINKHKNKIIYLQRNKSWPKGQNFIVHAEMLIMQYLLILDKLDSSEKPHVWVAGTKRPCSGCFHSMQHIATKLKNLELIHGAREGKVWPGPSTNYLNNTPDSVGASTFNVLKNKFTQYESNNGFQTYVTSLPKLTNNAETLKDLFDTQTAAGKQPKYSEHPEYGSIWGSDESDYDNTVNDQSIENSIFKMDDDPGALLVSTFISNIKAVFSNISKIDYRPAIINGDCLFDVIAHYVGSGANAASIRKKVIDELNNKSSKYFDKFKSEWLSFVTGFAEVKNKLEYLNHMKNDGTWGTEREIQALSAIRFPNAAGNSYKIYVYDPTEGKLKYFENGKVEILRSCDKDSRVPAWAKKHPLNITSNTIFLVNTGGNFFVSMK